MGPKPRSSPQPSPPTPEGPPETPLRCEVCSTPQPWRWVGAPYHRLLGLPEPGWAPGSCPTCLAREQEEARAALRRALLQARQAALEERLAATGIPPRFAQASFENFEHNQPGQRAVLTQCRRFAEEFAEHRRHGTWLLFSGRSGTGKTHLAVAIARTVMGQGFSVAMCEYPDLMDAIRATYRQPQLTVLELVRSLREVDLLILDEVDRSWGSTDGAQLWQILNGRYRALRPLILISNLSYRDLARVLDASLVSRFQEEPNRILLFSWESYRRQKPLADSPWDRPRLPEEAA